jgi:hypothetical protein
MMTSDDGDRSRISHPKARRNVPLLAWAGVVVAMGTLATAFAPALAAHHPLLLLVLNSRNPFLILAHDVAVVPFVVVALVRRGLGESAFYFLGRHYGPDALVRLQKRSRTGRLSGALEQGVARAAYPMVTLVPGAIVFMLAGATAMRPVAFFGCNLGGTLAAVIVLRSLADSFSSPIDAVVALIERNLVLHVHLGRLCRRVSGTQMVIRSVKPSAQPQSISAEEVGIMTGLVCPVSRSIRRAVASEPRYTRDLVEGPSSRFVMVTFRTDICRTERSGRP